MTPATPMLVMIMDVPPLRFFESSPMQNWITFLEVQGARDIDPDSGAIGRFDAVAPTTDFMAPLTGYGLIEATGDDAATFLHNQLTNDVEKLDTTTVRLAGYCTPKGRLLATFLLWKTAEAIFLQVPRTVQPALQKRLQMFVMRAKAKLTDSGDRLVQLGLSGNAANEVLMQWFPTLPSVAYSRVDSDAGSLLRVADVPAQGATPAVPRHVWIAPAETLQAAWPALRAAVAPAGESTWQLGDIRAAVPTITLATQDKFVPQMINFEAVGGVNFQKGCYPGQEIVARSQYLGKLKRRMLPATIAGHKDRCGDVAPGMEVFSEDDPDQSCGMIVNAAALPSGEFACLVEVKLAASTTPVHLGSIDGPLLQFQALPYQLADADRPDLR